MLCNGIELVNEVALDSFEGLIHAVKNEVVPVRRETHELTKAARIILDQGEGDFAVKQAAFATKFYVSLSPQVSKIKLSEVLVR